MKGAEAPGTVGLGQAWRLQPVCEQESVGQECMWVLSGGHECAHGVLSGGHDLYVGKCWGLSGGHECGVHESERGRGSISGA